MIRGWARVIWLLLVLVDVLVVTGFGITAAADPYHVLEGKGVEVRDFPGLLPSMIVITLRSVVLAAERRLLTAGRHGLVLIGRLASLIGFYYTARWLYERAYGRSCEVLLGGTLGYALAGVIGTGLVALIYNLAQLRSAGRTRSDTTATARAARRRGLTRDSLFSLVGVFTSVTGLAMGVTDLLRLGLAILLGAVAVAGVAVLLRGQDGWRRRDRTPG
jgi:hypothetical protein